MQAREFDPEHASHSKKDNFELQAINADNDDKDEKDDKMKLKEELEKTLADNKKSLDYEEDFTAMTVLCYLKTNTDKFLIHPSKQAQHLYQCLLTHAIVIALLSCMLYAIKTDENGDYTPNIAHSFAVWFVKFPCTLSLHFVLYPEVANGMNIMKFTNNQPHLFVNNGSEIGFILGSIQVFTALLCEGICIYMLAYQHTVQHCIIHFVALEVIMEVGNLYFESLKENYLKNVMHHAPIADHRGQDIHFRERSIFHKFARVYYKVLRTFYVGVVFYFVPFSVMFIQWSTTNADPSTLPEH